jgi:DNA-binding transcriptional regulator LsrR (DeoR family)
MKAEERLALLYKVAQMFYEQRIKKYKIAKMVKQSPTQIAKLLEEAKRRGIVKITVSLPRLTVLQERLKAKYKLKEAIVIPYDRDCSALLIRLSKAAAEYFDNRVDDGSRVALGGGYLMYRMVNLLPERPRDIHIYPAAIIARGPTSAHLDPLVIVNSLWARSGQPKEKLHYVTVTPSDKPPKVDQLRQHYQELLRNRVVNGLFNEMKNTGWVFASIGSVDADPAYIQATNNSTRNLLDEIKLDDGSLRSQGVIGDIAYSFFDASGDTKRDWNIVATIGVDHLKRMVRENRNVVVVVGSYKLRALQAVLAGRICNVLITDATAAEKLLDNKTARLPD